MLDINEVATRLSALATAMKSRPLRSTLIIIVVLALAVSWKVIEVGIERWLTVERDNSPERAMPASRIAQRDATSNLTSEVKVYQLPKTTCQSSKRYKGTHT